MTSPFVNSVGNLVQGQPQQANIPQMQTPQGIPTQPNLQQANIPQMQTPQGIPAQPNLQQSDVRQPEIPVAPDLPQAESSAKAESAATDPIESLKKLKVLLDAGLIQQTEYDEKKKEILSRL